MPKLLEKFLEAVQRLPTDSQDNIALAMHRVGSTHRYAESS
jgi:hypothetical protein